MVQSLREILQGESGRVIAVMYQVYTISTVALDVAVDVKIELWTYLDEPALTGSKDRGERMEEPPSFGRGCRRQNRALDVYRKLVPLEVTGVALT